MFRGVLLGETAIKYRSFVVASVRVQVIPKIYYRRHLSGGMASGDIKIGTHDGVFHCDEALACFMLRQLPLYSSAQIVRTREPSRLADCHTVVDVGAVYDPAARRYDHHQREFTQTLSDVRPELGNKYTIKLSSAGLVYAHYGEDVIKQIAKKNNLDLDDGTVRLIYKKVYENIIQEIDAIDNGVPMCDSEPLYRIRTHISARVHRLNPEWISKQDHDMDELFCRAMALVGEDFQYTVTYWLTVWLPGRKLVADALENRFNVHSSGEIVEFTERFPWKEHLFDLETESGLDGVVKYAIFNDKPDSWRVQAVPVSPGSFVTRKPLHPDWWGVRDSELSGAAGIEGCVFCHATGFIAGNRTRAGALQMAAQSLQANCKS